jgi:hypothetical protein
MESPLTILIDLLVGLIKNIGQSIVFTFSKLIQLFTSLAYLGGLGIAGLLIAITIGSGILLLILKFIFGASMTVVKLGLILMSLFIVLALLFLIL